MAKEDLLREIDKAFDEAGEKDGWMYRSYKNLHRLKQLSHFQIFDINWFPGAARIIDLVDQLHTIETSVKDFLAIAKLLDLNIDSTQSKEVIAKIVKDNKDWRAKSFQLDTMKKIDLRKQQLEPLYEQLKKFGYHTNLLPRQIEFKRWILDALNEDGTPETIYLNESDNENYVWVQSNKKNFICLVDAVEMGLIEII